MTKDAFGQLYLQLLPGFYRLALSILHQREDAMDAVQQAIEKAWKASTRIRSGEEKAYITRIVINECRNIQRHRMRIVPGAEEFTDIPSAADPPDAALADAISGLPEKLRLPLLLRYMEGYSEKEAAEALRISVPALKSRLFKARSMLKEFMMEEAEEQ